MGVESCHMNGVNYVLEGFAKDKISGPDDWMVEFFLFFFELLGEEILEAVEKSRRIGRVISAINSTFVALIPKVDHPLSWNDFRPISLCNLIYKINAKIIANRLKGGLSKGMSMAIWVLGRKTDSRCKCSFSRDYL